MKELNENAIQMRAPHCKVSPGGESLPKEEVFPSYLRQILLLDSGSSSFPSFQWPCTIIYLAIL